MTQSRGECPLVQRVRIKWLFFFGGQEEEAVVGDTVDVVSSTLKEETGVWIISGAECRGAGVGSNFQEVFAPSSASTALKPGGGRPVRDNKHRPQDNIFLS